MQWSIVLAAMVLIGAEAAPGGAPEPPDPRAEVLLRSAENLDRAGKPKGAIDFYRQLVKEVWSTDNAPIASCRIDGLGGMVPSRSEAVTPMPADESRPPVRRRWASQQAVSGALDGV